MRAAHSFSDPPPARDRIVVEVDILKDKLGCLIGTGGSNLKAIVAACNNAAQINVPDRQRMLDATPPQSKFATVTITGTVTGVFQAIREVQTYCEVALVEAHIKTRLDPVYTLAFLQSDNDRVDAMHNMCTQHDVKILLDRRDSFIAIEGAPSGVEACVAKISKLLPDTSAPPTRAPKPMTTRPSASAASSKDRQAFDRPKTAPSAPSAAAPPAPARAHKLPDAALAPKSDGGGKANVKKGAQPGNESKSGKAAKEPKQPSVVTAAAAPSPLPAAVAPEGPASDAAPAAAATGGDAPAKKKRGGRGKKKGAAAAAGEAGEAAGGSGED